MLKNNIRYVLSYFILALFLFSYHLALSQETNNNNSLYEASFVKPEILQKNGELSFNVVRINNNSDSAINIQPILDLPQGWAMFSTAFKDTIVPPHSQISLPFRFRTPVVAKSNIEYKIDFKAFYAKKKILIESNFIVKLEAFHSWDVVIPKKRIFFYPEMNTARFEIIIINKGNASELISLDVSPDSKITLEGINATGFRHEITLAPNSDTMLIFDASYTYDIDRVFDISKVQIHASSSDKKIYRAVLIEKYSDTYAPFEIDRNLAHETELGVRIFSNQEKTLPFIKARGNALFKNESTFKYNFTYFDLTKSENLISNSYYNFLYNWNSFNVGLGAFSSQLGRNLYSRNSIMVSNTVNISDVSSIEGFASYNLTSPKTSLAVGYNFNNDKVNMKGSVAYDVDGFKKTNTASLILNSGRVTFAKNNDVSIILYGYHESHYLTDKYEQLGIAWDINYFGKISKNLSFQFTNNYGSPDIPGPQMGLLNFLTKLKYNLSNPKNYITAQYLNSSRDYYNIDREGAKMPSIMLSDQYASILFHSNTNKKIRWYVGPSIEFYNSSTPIINQDSRVVYSINKYRLEYKGFIGHNFMINAKYGIGESLYQAIDDFSDIRHDFHLLADYHNSGYGLRVSYDYGPMVNMGLYQYAMDAGNNSINISPFIIKTYLQGRVALSMFTNYTYKFDLKYGSLNINPRVETYVYKDWYVLLGGTYNYTQQRYDEFNSQNSFYYLEFSIKKRWGKSDYNKWKKDLRRLKVQLFKDANANGKMDNYEEGISDVKVRLQLTNTANQQVRENFPVDITLMSNDKGIVTFNRIPKGFYKITVIPLTDLQEYFYINKSTEQLELNKNSVFPIAFQKASKITGKVNLVRQKFKDSERSIDLANVKVTAFNKLGDSYSTFTTKDGSFVIFAPGNHSYTLRIKNVFGKNFRILNNDIQILLTDTVKAQVVFEIVEQNRKIKFKKATPVSTDSDKPKLQKIKVLPGKIYENANSKVVDKNAIPDFNIPDMAVEIVYIVSSKYYIIAGHVNNFEDAKKIMQILKEQGVKSYIGVTDELESYYVFTNYTNTRSEAKQLLSNYKRVEMRPLSIIKF